MRPEEIAKRNLLIDYAKRFHTTNFVETGTYKGDTVKAMVLSGLFQHIHTIDIYLDRVERAQGRFGNHPSVHCWHGDSAVMLPEIVATLNGPTLFWLDAHHSGKQIARKKGLIETPIVAELKTILAHRFANQHVILVDDARYYERFPKKYPNYPTTAALKSLVMEKFPEWVWDINNDIIRTHRAHDENTRKAG